MLQRSHHGWSLAASIAVCLAPLWLLFNVVFARDIVGVSLPARPWAVLAVAVQVLLPWSYGRWLGWGAWIMLVLVAPFGYVLSVLTLSRRCDLRAAVLAASPLVVLTTLSAVVAPRVGIVPNWILLMRGEWQPLLRFARDPLLGSLLLYVVLGAPLASTLLRFVWKRSSR